MRASCASSQRINEFPSRLSVVHCRKLSCSYAAWSILSEQTSRERLELAAPASSTGKVALVRENGAITPSTFAAASGRSNRTPRPTRGEQLTARNTKSGGTAAVSAAKEHRGKSLAACAPGAPSWRIAWVKSGSSTPGLREQVVQEGLSEVEVARLWLEALEAGHRILIRPQEVSSPRPQDEPEEERKPRPVKRRAEGEGQAKKPQRPRPGKNRFPLRKYVGAPGSKREEWFLSRGAVIASGYVVDWLPEGERGYRKVPPPGPQAAALTASASSIASGSLGVLLEAAEAKAEQLSPPQEGDSPVRKYRKLHQNAPIHRR